MGSWIPDDATRLRNDGHLTTLLSSPPRILCALATTPQWGYRGSRLPYSLPIPGIDTSGGTGFLDDDLGQ